MLLSFIYLLLYVQIRLLQMVHLVRCMEDFQGSQVRLLLLHLNSRLPPGCTWLTFFSRLFLSLFPSCSFFSSSSTSTTTCGNLDGYAFSNRKCDSPRTEREQKFSKKRNWFVLGVRAVRRERARERERINLRRQSLLEKQSTYTKERERNLYVCVHAMKYFDKKNNNKEERLEIETSVCVRERKCHRRLCVREWFD